MHPSIVLPVLIYPKVKLVFMNPVACDYDIAVRVNLFLYGQRCRNTLTASLSVKHLCSDDDTYYAAYSSSTLLSNIDMLVVSDLDYCCCE